MRILVIGGTWFVGRHFVEAALAAGHELTLFHRGLHGAGLFPDVPRILGDRETGLDQVTGRFDLAVDFCGFRPQSLDRAANALARRVDRYLFISTISVYRDFPHPGITESHPRATLSVPLTEELPIADHYGALKALAEDVVTAAFPDRHLIVRPGLIVGPHDKYTRLSYWIARAGRGGRMAVPGVPDKPVQFIDARDLGAFLLCLIDSDAVGTVHATGPATRLTHSGLIEAIRARTDGPAAPVWIPPGFAADQGIALPLPLGFWADTDPANAHILDVDIGRALSLGLSLRPVAETLRDIADWLARAGDDADLATVAPVERALLDAWDARA